MKILEIISGQFVNGALVHVDLLTRQLIQRGHEVHLLCRPRSWIWRKLHRTGINKRKSEMHRFPPDELWRIAKWIEAEKFDVIHTHMSRAHFFGVLLKGMTGIPCVATAHTSLFQLHWRLNDLVIANSDSTAWFNRHINRVPQKRLVTIPCFIDLDRFQAVDQQRRQQIRRELTLRGNQPVIGVVGAVTARKGQLELVAALPQLLMQFPDLKVLLIGQFNKSCRYYAKIRRSLLEKKLYRRVIWVGRRNNVHELIQALDLLVVPSLKEPLGLCALEAMAASIPVVASHRGGLKEFVIPEQTGLLFNPNNPVQIADAVSRGLTDVQWRQHVIANAHQMLLNRFTPSAITSQIESALESAIRPTATIQSNAK